MTPPNPGEPDVEAGDSDGVSEDGIEDDDDAVGDDGASF